MTVPLHAATYDAQEMLEHLDPSNAGALRRTLELLGRAHQMTADAVGHAARFIVLAERELEAIGRPSTEMPEDRVAGALGYVKQAHAIIHDQDPHGPGNPEDDFIEDVSAAELRRRGQADRIPPPNQGVGFRKIGHGYEELNRPEEKKH